MKIGKIIKMHLLYEFFNNDNDGNPNNEGMGSGADVGAIMVLVFGFVASIGWQVYRYHLNQISTGELIGYICLAFPVSYLLAIIAGNIILGISRGLSGEDNDCDF
jgi:hypothetical protein